DRGHGRRLRRACPAAAGEREAGRVVSEPGALSRRVVHRLTEVGQTVAAAESLSAGLVGATFAEVPGSSAVLRGGLVVSAAALKRVRAVVSRGLLAAYGPVHRDVAARVGGGARLRCETDWGLGLTGVAGPGSQDGVRPGIVHVAV